MSDRLICHVWKSFPTGGPCRTVMMAIAESASEQGNSARHIRDLAAVCQLSQSTVFVALKALRKERWIITDRVLGQGGTLIFQINTSKLARN